MQMNLKISDYHLRQHKKIYRSTVLFLRFIQKYENLNNKIILDIGCGAGANSIYIAKKFPKSKIIGVDRNKSAINFAKFLSKKKKITNCKFYNSDILSFRKKIKIDIILSFHFLSFTEVHYKKFLKKFFDLNAISMAHSSLFFDGDVEAKIDVNDFPQWSYESPDALVVLSNVTGGGNTFDIKEELKRLYRNVRHHELKDKKIVTTTLINCKAL